jgi:hypothetical protein
MRKKNASRIAQTNEVKIAVTPPVRRKRNPPRTAYSKTNPSPHAFPPGVSGNPSGKRKIDSTRLLSKALRVHLNARCPDEVASACGCEKYSSWAQVLGMSLSLRATLKGDLGCASLIASLVEEKGEAELENALVGPSFEIRFVESDGNGRPREIDSKSGFIPPLAREHAALPAPTIEGQTEGNENSARETSPETRQAFIGLGAATQPENYRPIRGAFRPGHG